MVTGKIHSLESFGTVDGPGVRFVVFLQGCLLRCLYCHNPDTWDVEVASKTMRPEELVKEVLKYKNFIKTGGVTCTGGEPLLQAEFVKTFFELCHKEGIHTALDTSGAVFNETVKAALAATDLVLLDVKSIEKTQHKTLTGGALLKTVCFLDYLQQIGKPVWVRHVLVPGMTDDNARLNALANFLKQYTVIQKIELLPYHKMGVHKYRALGMDDPLEGTEPLSSERLKWAKQLFLSHGFVLD